MRTEQEDFWSGSFGSEYTKRNMGSELEAMSLRLLGIELRSVAPDIKSAIEFGANRGLNLKALSHLYPNALLSAVEINLEAVELLRKIGNIDVHAESFLEFKPTQEHDLVVVSGVLIHTNPASLPDAYRCMATSSSKYVLISEYYSPTPQSILYRGHENKLFKRDFAGEFLNLYPEFKLIDYGFHYKGAFTQGNDQTWFLLEKINNKNV
jgi:spore coat polysaccharide biosynthesis protein SpsF